ncbi:MAG: hypothetical protein VR72_13340 [Clostridiaceae bacterium BRH_c20a]|nr:MAG: hypothetical protein VR72_13340 [Clostridiaceae bacterium BRH_c20a]
MYYVNKKFVNLVRLFIPLGIALASGFFIENLASIRYFSVLFLLVGLVSNLYYPEIVIIEGKKLKLKLALSKKLKEYSMEGLDVGVDNRALYLILNLNRKYRLEVKTMSKDLYYQLKPYIKIRYQ